MGPFIPNNNCEFLSSQESRGNELVIKAQTVTRTPVKFVTTSVFELKYVNDLDTLKTSIM